MEMLADLLTAKEALQRLAAIDEKLETVKVALAPSSTADDATIDELIWLKVELQGQRQATACLVRELAELERQKGGTGWARRVARDRRLNADALDAARRLLAERHELRC